MVQYASCLPMRTWALMNMHGPGCKFCIQSETLHIEATNLLQNLSFMDTVCFRSSLRIVSQPNGLLPRQNYGLSVRTPNAVDKSTINSIVSALRRGALALSYAFRVRHEQIFCSIRAASKCDEDRAKESETNDLIEAAAAGRWPTEEHRSRSGGTGRPGNCVYLPNVP